ncbi:MAG: Undecaprenyl-phosphate mannosyltransferase [candidate division TA06 bacterium ADurb.Bin131]|uniref:Undecaprenyl-phosphate mannosyltransferase n=1 Tax=candidate division TA06 bacterium ADurb.Bin131 TaxID=1852827 RepID=A0A1V6C489_UNCT6|nr:MAG: Undecaprenyl-phosphate mannosyltransferase [candidate division TA06 bacterium ADurb.Bin131]
MKLSVIVPVYNEKNTIEVIIQKLLTVPINKEIIIVDDGSTDGTSQILKKISQQKFPLIKVIFQPKNIGKGYAIRRAINEITGDVVVIQDADLEYEPMDYLRMIEPIEQGRADVVYGSRILGKNQTSSFSFYVGGRILSFFTNLLYGTSITDEPTCYKMFKSDILKGIKLNCKGFEFCPEVTAKIAKKKIRIYEVPIRYTPRKIREGKKIRWKDGVIAIWTLIRYRF